MNMERRRFKKPKGSQYPTRSKSNLDLGSFGTSGPTLPPLVPPARQTDVLAGIKKDQILLLRPPSVPPQWVKIYNVLPPINTAKPGPVSEDVSEDVQSLCRSSRPSEGKVQFGDLSQHHTGDVLLETCNIPEDTAVSSKGRVNCKGTVLSSMYGFKKEIAHANNMSDMKSKTKGVFCTGDDCLDVVHTEIHSSPEKMEQDSLLEQGLPTSTESEDLASSVHCDALDTFPSADGDSKLELGLPAQEVELLPAAPVIDSQTNDPGGAQAQTPPDGPVDQPEVCDNPPVSTATVDEDDPADGQTVISLETLEYLIKGVVKGLNRAGTFFLKRPTHKDTSSVLSDVRQELEEENGIWVTSSLTESAAFSSVEDQNNMVDVAIDVLLNPKFCQDEEALYILARMIAICICRQARGGLNREGTPSESQKSSKPESNPELSPSGTSGRTLQPNGLSAVKKGRIFLLRPPGFPPQRVQRLQVLPPIQSAKPVSVSEEDVLSLYTSSRSSVVERSALTAKERPVVQTEVHEDPLLTTDTAKEDNPADGQTVISVETLEYVTKGVVKGLKQAGNFFLEKPTYGDLSSVFNDVRRELEEEKGIQVSSSKTESAVFWSVEAQNNMVDIAVKILLNPKYSGDELGLYILARMIAICICSRANGEDQLVCHDTSDETATDGSVEASVHLDHSCTPETPTCTDSFMEDPDDGGSCLVKATKRSKTMKANDCLKFDDDCGLVKATKRSRTMETDDCEKSDDDCGLVKATKRSRTMKTDDCEKSDDDCGLVKATKWSKRTVKIQFKKRDDGSGLVKASKRSTASYNRKPVEEACDRSDVRLNKSNLNATDVSIEATSSGKDPTDSGSGLVKATEYSTVSCQGKLDNGLSGRSDECSGLVKASKCSNKPTKSSVCEERHDDVAGLVKASNYDTCSSLKHNAVGSERQTSGFKGTKNLYKTSDTPSPSKSETSFLDYAEASTSNVTGKPKKRSLFRRFISSLAKVFCFPCMEGSLDESAFSRMPDQHIQRRSSRDLDQQRERKEG